MKKVSEKVRIDISPRQGNGEVPTDEELREALASADWTDDPGVGKAVLLPDGSELVSPVPHALPLGYVKEKSVTEIIDERLAAHRRLLQENDEIDTEDEMNDFEVDEEPDIFTLYEFSAMSDDWPGKRPEDTPAPPPKAAEPGISPAERIPKNKNNDDSGDGKGGDNEEGGR